MLPDAEDYNDIGVEPRVCTPRCNSWVDTVMGEKLQASGQEGISVGT